MKIIKPGVILEDLPKQCVCPKCGCVFEYTKADIQSSYQNERYVICPESKCGKYIDV
jgi:rubredoxin